MRGEHLVRPSHSVSEVQYMRLERASTLCVLMVMHVAASILSVEIRGLNYRSWAAYRRI